MDKTSLYRSIASKPFTAMSSGDFSDLEKFMSEEIIFDFPGSKPVEGRKRSLIFFKTLLRKFSKLKFSVSEIFVEGNAACVVWTNKGESNAGEPYENSGMTLIRFANDKIIFLSDYFKDTSFVKSD